MYCRVLDNYKDIAHPGKIIQSVSFITKGSVVLRQKKGDHRAFIQLPTHSTFGAYQCLINCKAEYYYTSVAEDASPQISKKDVSKDRTDFLTRSNPGGSSSGSFVTLMKVNRKIFLECCDVYEKTQAVLLSSGKHRHEVFRQTAKEQRKQLKLNKTQLCPS